MDMQQTIIYALAETLRDRSIVHTDPAVMSGVPVFIGTRVPLQTLFDYLEDEDGLSEFSEDFPHLKIPAIQVLKSTTFDKTFCIDLLIRETQYSQ